MGMRDQIVDLVERGVVTIEALTDQLGANQKIVSMQVAGAVKAGSLKWDGDALVAGDGQPEAIPTKRAYRKAPKQPPPEEDVAILFACDEDGDLQLSRRDGEGEILTIPGTELDRLMRFIKKHF